jgi:hypothetical protein
MAANQERVLKRITEILNLCDPGTYSKTLSGRNKTRNQQAIADFTAEAGLMICKAIAERPNEFRRGFLSDTPAITTSGDPMPEHVGPPAKILITPHPGGSPIEAKRSSYDKIQSYRENPETVYDSVGHDEAGSTLSGLYDIWDDRFFFTGVSAVLSLARPPSRTDNANLIPEIMENTWIRLGVGEAGKVGVSEYAARVIGEYGEKGRGDLEEFKMGGRTFSEVDVPQQVPTDHNLVK